jgi:hyperosmotically inducible protein
MTMKTRKSCIFVLTAILVLTFAGASFAQSASEKMHEAGQSAKQAGSSAGHAISHAYHGTATAVSDTAITAKVKARLHSDKLAKTGEIHVKTVDGVVTLSGHVPSEAVADRAHEVAEHTNGVKSVNDELRVLESSSQ